MLLLFNLIIQFTDKLVLHLNSLNGAIHYLDACIMITIVDMDPFVCLLSTEWVDYVEEPMKYQALRPHFFSVGER